MRSPKYILKYGVLIYALLAGKPAIAANLYDVQFGVYGNNKSATTRAECVKRNLPKEMRDFVEIGKYGNLYKVFLNVNAAEDTAKRIKQTWKKDKEAVVVKDIKFFGKNAYLNNDKFPVKFIKKENVDYKNIELKRNSPLRRTLYSIASSFTSDNFDLGERINRILEFNGINKEKTRTLPNGMKIAIPNDIYKKPGKRTIEDNIEENLPHNGGVIIIEEPNLPIQHGKIERPVNNGLFEKDFQVLRYTKIPSVLIESFFMSNYGDLTYFLDSKNLNNFANLCVTGIVNYKKENNRNLGNVVIEVGHGKNDPGAIRKGYKENEFNREIANRMKVDLTNLGYKVIMLDYAGEPKQEKRLDYVVREANKFNKDNSIFISVHTNASHNPFKAGTRVYVPKGNNPKSDALGDSIIDALKA
jgi:N-acetylmuramoyl-L-alanine amidase